MDDMTAEEIHKKLEKGYDEIEAGSCSLRIRKCKEIVQPDCGCILTLETMPERIRIMDAELERSKERRLKD